MPRWLFETVQANDRQLEPGDLPAINALFARCADYALLVEGEPPAPDAANGIFENRPPGVAASDHFTVGLYHPSDELIGLIEALRDYPDLSTTYLGLMLLDPDHRGEGVGSAVHDAFAVWARQHGAKRLMLSVVEENGAAYRFWQRLGYRQTRVLPPTRFKQKTHSRFELKLDLEHSVPEPKRPLPR